MARFADANVATTLPSLSMTKLARFAQPSCSLNTPYAFATAPWGQKSESTGNVKPCCSAHWACAWRVSQEIASTAASADSKVDGSSRISQSSPWHTPVKVNG